MAATENQRIQIEAAARFARWTLEEHLSDPDPDLLTTALSRLGEVLGPPQDKGTPSPSNEHMREVAERFLSGEDRKLQTAKHLACYVLALLDDFEESEEA